MEIPVALTRITLPPVAAELVRYQLLPLIGSKRLTAVVAGPGYGKSTLVCAWAHEQKDPVAYHVLFGATEDAVGLVDHLSWAARQVRPEVPEPEGTGWRARADRLINGLGSGKFWFVIDDMHHLKAAEALDYLLKFTPPNVGFVLSGRDLGGLEWEGRVLAGEAATISASQLALSLDELEELVEPELVRALHEATGGWPMACHYLASRMGQADWLQHKQSLQERLSELVWDNLDEELQRFLTLTSSLDFLEAEACRLVTGREDAPRILRRLATEGVFIQPWGEGRYRIHPMFREFLNDRLCRHPELMRQAFLAASQWLMEQGRALEAVPYLAESNQPQEAARLLKEAAPNLLSQGRHSVLVELARPLAPDTDRELLLYLADAHRHDNSYSQALTLYHQAVDWARQQEDLEFEADALTGMARIFIDTVRPSQAAEYLRQAYRVLPHRANDKRAEVLRLLAENSINQGRSRAAQRYSRWADNLGGQPGGPRMEARLLLRTGKLRQARAAITEALHAGGAHPASAHREARLVLAYLATLEGESERAEQLAREGLEEAQKKDSSLTQAVAWMRLGHALQLQPDRNPEEVHRCYQEAVQLASEAGVARTRAEALMGQALFLASLGQSGQAQHLAEEGLAITREAGDGWLSAWLLMTAAIASGKVEQFELARREMDQCRDAFGQAVAGLWLATLNKSDMDLMRRLLHERGYAFLLERPTLFGPRQPGSPAEAKLRVVAFGPMRVFRDGEELEGRHFKRRKARELLALFLSQPNQPCRRDQLMETLWPDSDPKAAARDFRVALHALSQALDPDRPKNTIARFIERREEVYTFVLDGEIHYDVAEFERLIDTGAQSPDPMPFWRRAISLYHGDFLEDYAYEDWPVALREKLRLQYLETAERVVEGYLDEGETDKAVELAHTMISHDRCWEEAYRLLLRAYLDTDRATLAARVYRQCVDALEDELGVPPSEETEALAARIAHR